MNLLSWGYVVVAAVCFTVAFQQLMIATRLRDRLAYALFGLTSEAAALDAVAERRRRR